MHHLGKLFLLPRDLNLSKLSDHHSFGLTNVPLMNDYSKLRDRWASKEKKNKELEACLEKIEASLKEAKANLGHYKAKVDCLNQVV